MGVEYDDHPILEEQKDEAAKRAKGKKPTPSKEKKPTKAKGPRCVVRKCKASEPSDVPLCRKLARPSKKSQKFTFGGSNRDSGATGIEGVCGGLGIVSFLCQRLSLFGWVFFLTGTCDVFTYLIMFIFHPRSSLGYLDV